MLDGYRTWLTGMTADEADALFLAGQPGAAADLGLGSVLAATQLKLLAALPADLRERANRAMVEGRLDPLGLVLKAGTWYLVASADARGPRTYRISRVHAAAVRDEPFERPAGFDLEAFRAEYQRGYERRVYRRTALVRLSPAGRELLFLVGTIPARRPRAAMSDPDAEGWTTTRIPIESVRHAQHALLRLGDPAEVLESAELRAAIERTAHALAARYSGGSD